MKEKAIAFIHGLIEYDYILFGGVFVVFLLFIILAIIFRNKTGVAVFFFLLSLAVLFLAPPLGYIQMHKLLFKKELKLTEQKKLHFLDAVVVKGVLSNTSKFDFSTCRVSASVFKTSKNFLRNYIYKFKPLQTTSTTIQDIKQQQSADFKIIVEPFRYTGDYNVSLEADCK